MIDKKNTEFANLAPLFDKSKALIGGTEAMRSAGKKYLPQMAMEDDADYQRRLNVSVLHAVYAETIKQMVGRVFSTPISRDNILIDDRFIEDFDNGGNDIDSVLSETFTHGLAFGKAFALVTAPQASDVETLADELAQNVRPYVAVIHPSNVLSVTRDKDKITKFRYMSSYLIEDENFEETEVKEIRVHTAGLMERYVESKNGFELVESLEMRGSNGLLPSVPVAELNLDEALPLGNLADLNIKHWQSQSDQDNILTYARVPMLSVVGAQEADLKVGGTISFLPEGGKMGWVEHSGQAIEAGRKSIEDIEYRCQAEGAKLLSRTKVALTDSQAKDEQSKDISRLRHFANKLEDFAEKLLYFYALYAGQEEGGFVDISGSVDEDIDATQALQLVQNGVINGYLSKQTAYLVTKSVIPAIKNDWETEQTLIDESPTI